MVRASDPSGRCTAAARRGSIGDDGQRRGRRVEPTASPPPTTGWRRCHAASSSPRCTAREIGMKAFRYLRPQRNTRPGKAKARRHRSPRTYQLANTFMRTTTGDRWSIIGGHDHRGKHRSMRVSPRPWGSMGRIFGGRDGDDPSLSTDGAGQTHHLRYGVVDLDLFARPFRRGRRRSSELVGGLRPTPPSAHIGDAASSSLRCAGDSEAVWPLLMVRVLGRRRYVEAHGLIL